MSIAANPIPASSESGNALIELALTLPLFVLIILGTAEIANVAWSSIQVNNAAHAGAQFGAQSRATAGDTTDISIAAKNDAPALTQMNVTSTQTCTCVDSSGTATSLACDDNALSNCPSPNIIQVAVQVNTSALVTPFIHYPGLPATYTITAQATMDVLQ